MGAVSCLWSLVCRPADTPGCVVHAMEPCHAVLFGQLVFCDQHVHVCDALGVRVEQMVKEVREAAISCNFLQFFLLRALQRAD